MPYTNRELFARLLKCEAGGEGIEGLRAVSSVVMNRVLVQYGEYFRLCQGDIRCVIEQIDQFTCMKEVVGGQYNPQNVYNSEPEDIHYEIADWAMSGNIFNPVSNSLWYFNPFNPECPSYFPYNGSGLIHNRIVQHCFYIPTQKYAQT